MDPYRSPEVEKLLNADAVLNAASGAGTRPLQPVIGEATQSLATVISHNPALAGAMPEFNESFERYRVLRVIGEGGMGKVYMAEQLEPVHRTVALKVIKPGMDSEHVIARFDAERQVLAMMDHPNIAKILDAGSTASGQPYFVMELVDGLPLINHCNVHRLTIRERLSLFIPVCRAIQHAHQKGIIHRDIKPSNILVATYDGKPVPKVIDFGVAKATEHRPVEGNTLTLIGSVIGTFAYMSPEQANTGALDLDTRSDVYSLGAVLYQLLTGATPIDTDVSKIGYLEMLRRVREDEPRPPSSRLSTSDAPITVAEQRKTDPGSLERIIHGELDWIVLKALEKDRARRYATANDLLRDLERYLSGEPLEAGPASAIYRLRKLAHKHRGLLATVTAFIALLVVAASVSVWQAVRANRERDRAVAALHIVTAEKLAGEAKESMSSDPERSIILAMHAVNATLQFQQPPSPAAEGALHAAVLSSRIRATLRGHKQDVRALAFSPDGKRVVTGGDDGLVKIWDAADGRELLSFRGRGGISGIAFSPDGRRVATANPDKTATLWNASTGEEALSFHGHEHSYVTSVAFSADGARLATASLDRTARMWDVATGREVRAFHGHTGGVWSVAFSPDGMRLVTASDDATARVWNCGDGRELLKLTGHGRSVVSATFSADGKRLATSSSDRTAKVWDAESGQELLTVRDESSMTWVAFSPDGISLATAGRSAKVWDAVNGQELVTLRGRAVSKLAFSPKGDRLAVAGLNHAVDILDTGAGAELLTFTATANKREIAGVVFSPDRARLGTFDTHGLLKVWDASNGQLLRTVNAHQEPISDGRFSPEGNRFATASYDKTAKLWDLATGRELLIMRGHKDAVLSVAFSPSGNRVATSSVDKSVKLWDLATGREWLTLSGHEGYIQQVVFSPDAKRIATASSDRSVKVWDANDGRQLFTLRGDLPLRGVAFSPDGQRLAATVVGPDAKVRTWSAVDGRAQFTMQTSSLMVAFSPDGNRLATAAFSDIALWDARTGQRLFTLPGSPNASQDRRPVPIATMDFSRDGRRLVTSDYFGMIKVYVLDVPELMALARTRVSRQFTSAECWNYFQSVVCPVLP